MADDDRNLRPWESSRGQAFSEALTDWLLQLDVRPYDERQRKMIWRNLCTQDRRTKWHFPALPYDVETEENADRLLPTFQYDFKKLGDRWIFYGFRFGGSWQCDPDTGNIVVPTLGAWSNIMDSQNHYRQSRGWPLLRSPCYRFIYDSGRCTCNECLVAPGDSEVSGSDDADIVQSIVDPQSSSASQHSQEARRAKNGPSTTETNASVRRVRFLVASSESSRVRFLVSNPDISAPPTRPVTTTRSTQQPNDATRRRSILKTDVTASAHQSSGRAQTVNAISRTQDFPPASPPLLSWLGILVARIKAYSTQAQPIRVSTSTNVASQPVRVQVRRSPELVSLLEQAMATPFPSPTNRSATHSNSISVSVSVSIPSSSDHDPGHRCSDDSDIDDVASDNEGESDDYSTDSDSYVSLFHCDDDEFILSEAPSNPDWEIIRCAA